MAFGAIHNMSSDADSIRLIRAKEGIPLVVELLKSEQSVGGVGASCETRRLTHGLKGVVWWFQSRVKG